MKNFNKTTMYETEILEVSSPNGKIVIAIDTSDGMNVVSIKFNGVEYIEYSPERRANGETYGVPLLYPTPNRIAGGKFTFDGKESVGIMHGLIKKADFAIDELTETETATIVKAHVDFAPETELFKNFAYNSRFQITIEVSDSAVEWKYCVQNNSDETLPYSFALHPFFIKPAKTKIKASVNAVMEMSQDCYPSGNLLRPSVQGFDINDITSAHDIQYDHVFCVEDTTRAAEIFYPSLQTSISFATSEEFKRLVVFTPAGKDFICLENQTSSTDCHNLHTLGFVREANLQMVNPHEEKTGFARFCFGNT